MSINEGLGTAINIRVMERCDWINLQRKNFWATSFFFPAMLLRVAIAGKARIAYHWVTEKKRNITLNNQRRSCNFDKLRKEESSLSYWVVASENEGSRPSCEWKWGAQGDWGQQPFSPIRNPHGKAIENPTGLPKPSPRPWLKHLQVNLQAHLEAMHALSSDTAEQGPAPVLQHQHECYQTL